MRVHNFGSGPAMLPQAVLDRVVEGLGDPAAPMTVLELSHRSDDFQAIADHAEATLRRLMGIPDGYTVLFLQGGATLQFSAIPLNLSSPTDTSDHLITGIWSEQAHKEAARLGQATVVASSAPDYTTVPDPAEWNLTPDAAYFAYSANETIHGVEVPFVPDTGDVPLVADFSSTILSRPIDVSRFGIIYAGAQKNLGIAGLTVVIIRDDLLGKARAETPLLLDYSVMAARGSMKNTPPTFAWWVAGLVLDWIDAEGGVAAMATRNQAQQERLYAAIDASPLYRNPVDPAYRSWTTIPFTLADPELDGAFLAGAKEAGLVGLKGHRSVGGMRACLYNAMTDAGVDALIEFMADFERAQAGAVSKSRVG